MTEPKLVCPHCCVEIHLTESLAAPLVAAAREQFQKQLDAQNEQIIKREEQIRAQTKELVEAKRSLDETVSDQVAEKLQAERALIILDEAKKAKLASGLELETEKKKVLEANQRVVEFEAKLCEAQKTQAKLLEQQRALDEQKRELDLTIQTKINEGLAAVQASTKKQVEDQEKLKQAEKDEKISSLTKQIDILKQKAEQGSQQLQGEVAELELEMLLRGGFPIDTICPVPKGEFGGDILHRIFGQGGQHCGTILWETKRTKTWSDGWLAKLRGDQRIAKAEIAVIVSQTLPKDIELFDIVDGIWVVSPKAIVPVATMLRQSIVQLSAARQSSEGQQTKTELMYQYLTGPQFRQRVEAIVEAFSSMSDDLNRERQVIMKQWAKREKQIHNVMAATSGMWGDLQGISGKSFAELEGLDFADEPATAFDPATQTALPGL